MTIDDDRLREFMRIYEKEFGEELSEGEARIVSGRLMFLYERLARPLPSERKAWEPGLGASGTSGT